MLSRCRADSQLSQKMIVFNDNDQIREISHYGKQLKFNFQLCSDVQTYFFFATFSVTVMHGT